MVKTDNLKDRCRVATNKEDDRFVGIKANVDEAIVYFPLGFQIPDSDEEIRNDILHLFNIIDEFKDTEEGILTIDNKESSDIVEFPLNAYLEVISYFMENGYYIESDPIYKTRVKGNISWSKTIKKQKPLIQENKDGSFSPIYTQFTVKEFTPNDNKEIIYINKHCVYESFKKLGWLFTSYVPPKPDGFLDKKRFLPVLYNKLANTFNDSEKKLFQAMIEILEKMDNYNNQKQQYFGTEKFEHIWERLIDNAFGIPNKENYYPRAKWILPQGEFKSELKHALQPDTIMKNGDEIYVLDAKYYKFGRTNDPSDLPKSSDVNKQITYAEFIPINNADVDENNIYNAFLMPYNKEKNKINSHANFVNVGEVVGDWKTNELNYEHIQGFLVDVKYLMYNYKGNKESRIFQLAEAIKTSCKNNREFYDKSKQF